MPVVTEPSTSVPLTTWKLLAVTVFALSDTLKRSVPSGEALGKVKTAMPDRVVVVSCVLTPPATRL